MIRAWNFVTAWPRAFVSWLHTAICALTTDEGRKGWAMLAALGCCVVMTLYAAAVLYLVRGNQWFAFLLGLSAMATNLVVVTGLMVLLGVHRNITGKHGDDSISIEDK
jgi:hypothetical protein